MADDKSQTGKADRDRVSGSEDYEIRDFAEAAGISIEKARELVKKHGNNRDTLMAATKAGQNAT